MKNKGFTPHHFLTNGLTSPKTTKENGGGFTLIEIIVGVGIFTLLLTALSGFFVGAIQAQRKTLVSQELIDNVSYNLEYISRAIRMAKKDLTGDCITAKNNYEITPGGNGIKFKNYQGDCQEFFWDANKTLDPNTKRLYESKNGGTPLPLTPTNLEVTSFILGGSESWGQDEETQPKVTLFLEVKGKGQKPELQSSISIQTTISQRNLNVPR